jgi:hypothetical protein
MLRVIVTRRQADVAPWTQFCGYYVTVPSNVNIN